jgi:uncharacterized protein YndB with AHSA1/START domain
MRKNILLGLAVVVLLLLILIQTRPGTFHVERSSTIAAPPQAVFDAVNDFREWELWSPWAKLDPGMKKVYEGGPGVGQKFHWAGNDKAGEGEMRITESAPTSRIGMQLDFIKPFAGSNTFTFTFTPEEAGTKVVWAMDGKADFLAKAMCLVRSMDAMIGPDFEKGLTDLARVAVLRGAAPADSAGPAPADSAGAAR